MYNTGLIIYVGPEEHIASRRVVEGLLVTADIGAKSGCFIWAKGHHGGTEGYGQGGGEMREGEGGEEESGRGQSCI